MNYAKFVIYTGVVVQITGSYCEQLSSLHKLTKKFEYTRFIRKVVHHLVYITLLQRKPRMWPWLAS